MKLAVLFVDDEINILKGLKRTLLFMCDEWDLHFANSGKEALEILKNEQIDIVISDMKMPGMDGAELLGAIKQLYPGIVRIILSGHLDKELILKSVNPAHQYLSKPVEIENLKNVIQRAHTIKELLVGKEIRKKISQIETLPSLPELYQKIMAEIRSDDPSIKKIGNIISKDIAMSAKILQLVNSAFFGLPRHISDITLAVSLLGLETIKALVLTVQVFSQFKLESFRGISISKIWEHSKKVGSMAKLISLEENREDKIMADYALIAGFLHDIGKLVLMTNFAQKYQDVIDLTHREKIDYYQAEIKVLGISHSEVGAYLLGLWGLPNSLIEAIAFHHRPSQFMNVNFTALSAVHVANVIESEQSLHNNFIEFDLQYLENIGIINKLDHYKKICKEILEQGEDNE